ncbi:MAG: hypothetical protein ACOZCO_00670 [Bacteroidota bacterium]
MREYRVNNVLPVSATNLTEGIYVVMYNATSTPPHILLSVYGKYFSLSVYGLKANEDTFKLLTTAEKKKSKCLFIELDPSALFVENENVRKVCEYVFSGYGEIVENTKTCLFPVRDSLSEIFNKEFSHCQYVFELYDKLVEYGLVKNGFQLFMDTETKDGSFKMNTYSLEEINNSISELKNSLVSDVSR